MTLYINFLGKTIHPYGICCILGIAISIVIAFVLANKKGFEFFDFTLVIIITLLSALIGSKILFLIVSWESVCTIFQTYALGDAILSIMQGGFVFYGGLIGGIIGFIITLKVKKANFFDYANIFTLVLPLGHAFGRMGCFFAGCCYGVEYSGVFSYTYSSALDVSTPLGVPLFPVQLIESILLFVLFALALLVYFLPKYRDNVCYVYLIGYSVLRFVLEFFRGDLERGLLFNLSTSQWVSIIIFLITMTYLFISKIKNKMKKAIK